MNDLLPLVLSCLLERIDLVVVVRLVCLFVTESERVLLIVFVSSRPLLPVTFNILKLIIFK